MFQKIKFFLGRIVKAILPYGIVKIYKQIKDNTKSDKNAQLIAKKLTPKKELYFEIHLAEHCNLNCAFCGHFSCIAKESYLDLTAFDRDLERLAQITDKKVAYINLLGGEPLLHPQCSEIMRIARKHFDSVTNIILLTNGILLTKQNELFWQSAHNNGVWIAITPYPIKLNIEAIRRLSVKYGVPCGYTNRVGIRDFARVINDNEINTFYKFPLDLQGKQNAEQSFLHCARANKCFTLWDGKLYTCSLLPYIRHFNSFFGKNLPVTEQDYIDIYKAQSTDEILNFLAKPVPFCRFCKTQAITYRHKWSISKKQISEWT